MKAKFPLSLRQRLSASPALRSLRKPIPPRFPLRFRLMEICLVGRAGCGAGSGIQTCAYGGKILDLPPFFTRTRRHDPRPAASGQRFLYILFRGNQQIPGLWFNFACGANYPHQALKAKGGLFCICVERS